MPAASWTALEKLLCYCTIFKLCKISSCILGSLCNSLPQYMLSKALFFKTHTTIEQQEASVLLVGLLCKLFKTMYSVVQAVQNQHY